MSDQLLWSLGRLSELLGDDDAHVRRWTTERLMKLFPDKAARVLVDALFDPDKLVRIDALHFIQNAGNAAIAGPIIAQRMNLAVCDDFGRLAHALASMGYLEGLSIVLEHLADHQRSRRTSRHRVSSRVLPRLWAHPD